MDSDTRRKIEETVLCILKKTNLEEMTEFKVREMTSEQLGIELSDTEYKSFVRSVIESFLMSATEPEGNAEQEPMETNVREEQGARLKKEASEDGGRLICKLSSRRSVVINDFKERTYVSIRDFYQKDGKQIRAPRGISLPVEQWATFKKSVPAIEEAIKKLESKLRSELESKQTEHCKQAEDTSNSLNDFAPQELATVETSRYDGKNYPFWAQQMELLLKQLKVKYVLFQPRPSSTLGPEATSEEIAHSKAAEQKWVNDDLVCRRRILNALSDDLFYLYSKKTMTARELWEDLKHMYLFEQFGTDRTLVKKYIEFEMLEGRPILEQVMEFNRIADSIVNSGMTVEEKFHVSVIISKLPSSWKDVYIKLLCEEHLPFSMLMDRLKVEEESRIGGNQRVPFNLTSDLPGKSVPRQRDKKPRSMQWKRPEVETNGRVTCHACGKKGHIASHCRYRSRKDDWEANDKKHKGNGSLPASVEVNISEKAFDREANEKQHDGDGSMRTSVEFNVSERAAE
ncbi:retrovirus-related Pol polyprotein from transposon TNT 1-94 [Pyrus communis]|uniref:retrovirus-related Pol polyprotein from transposon TNT 1-94 n=1 Tax=Pyrus communis TaxID=23211 RepID=UPI0035C1F2CD